MPWLEGWSNRIKLTLDGSKIDEDLTDFPLMINVASGTGRTNSDITDVFDELSTISGTKKIAVTTSDGETQCYIEIEIWDWINKDAYLWTKVPTITSGTNINLYLYYDKDQPDNTTYVENTGTYPATEVWDDNFKAVYHFSESSGQLIDSTSNNFNCTVNGSTTRNHDSPVGYAYNFDGSGDYAETLSNIGISSDDVRTSQVVIKANSTSQSQWAYYLGWGGTNTLIDWNMNHFNDTGRWGTSLWGVAYDYDSSVDIDTDNWHINTFRYDGSNVSSFIDLTEFGVNAHTPNTSDTHLFIGGGHYGGRDFNCKISEVRISDINRADAWLKADYYSVHDDLITFSDPDKSGPPVLSFSGYTYEIGLPVSRIVRAYRRDTGELVDETTSDSSGYYYLNTTISGEHSLVCLDDVGGNDYNDLIIGCATASGIGG